MTTRRQFLGGVGALGGAVIVGGLGACSTDDDGDAGPTSSSTSTASTAAREVTDGASLTVRPLEEAFFAGVPFVVTMRTLQTFAGLVGINRLFVTKALADANSRFVVAPNHDTLYAIAVLDLEAGPLVLELPDIPDRYHVLQVLDAWMGGVALLGTRATGGRAGTWVIARQGTEVSVPEGATRVDCPTRHAFILGRVRATEDDVDAAAAVAASITFGPLGGTGATSAPDPLGKAVGPPNEVGSNGAAYFDELGAFLALDAPVTDAQRSALAAVDDIVGPGRRPTVEHPDRAPELAEAVAAGLAALDGDLGTSGEQADGWQVNLDLGLAGDEPSLRERALIARSFWGPVPAEEAVYPRAVEASDGEPLDGSKRYAIRLPGDDLPPVDAFWSYTVYGKDLFFVPNEIDRFSISGETPGLVREGDGSVLIALQHDRPTDPMVNWLPVPEGPFGLVMRLYLPQRPVLDGTYGYPPVDVETG